MGRLSTFAAGFLALWAAFTAGATPPVGVTPGQFSVSASGAATYTIPIWAPSGPQGMQPNIALTYNSQSGNGYLGMGWSIQGLSSIYRCNLTAAQDPAPASITLTTSDGLCLDGQRLRLVSGTYGVAGSTYQTEIANFTNITATGATGMPISWFTAQTPDGRTYTYGYNGNSAVAAADTSVTLTWNLSQVSDSAGNGMTISYTANNGSSSVVPDTISWTAASHGSSTFTYTMKFNYGVNPSPTGTGGAGRFCTQPAGLVSKPLVVPACLLNGYVAGVQIEQASLLTSIAINYNSSPVKQYLLSYTPSAVTDRETLTQIQECSSNTTTCLSPTTFQYQNSLVSAAVGITTSATTASSAAINSAGVNARYDFNGDGYKDLYFCNSAGCYVEFGSATGFSAPASAPSNALMGDVLGTGTPGFMANNGGTWYFYSWNGTSFTGVSTGLAYDYTASQFALADMNSDGKADLLSFYGSPSTQTVTATTRLNMSTASGPSFSGTPVAAFSDGSALWIGLITPDTQGGGSPNFDFNGDGVPDFVLGEAICAPAAGQPCGTVVGEKYMALISNPNGTLGAEILTGFRPPGAGQVLFANVNNDACTDLVSGSTVYISTCSGAASSTMTTTWPVVAVMDWNGDGQSDLVESAGSGQNLYVQYSTANGFTSTGIANLNIVTNPNCIYFGFDANGDGLDDLGCANPASSGGGISYYAHNGALTPPDLLTTITDGFHNTTAQSYVPISHSNYAPGTGTYPDVPYPGPVYVTSQVVYSDPSVASGTYSQQFQYSSSLTNLQGRGWDGFGSMSQTDSRNSLTTTQYFLQTFPYTGLPAKQQLTNSSGTISQTISSPPPAPIILSSTAYQQRVFPYFSNVTTKTWEVGGSESGTLITTDSTNYTYDNYGNATKVVRTVTDNDPGSPPNPYSGDYWTVTTTNTPSPDTTNWCLNLLTQTQVAYTASTGASVTRTKTFTPDTSKCRYNTIVTEPNSSLYMVTEALKYDSFGNVNYDSVTGVNMPARIAQTTWSTTGQFPATVLNALSQTSTLTYDPVWGKVTSVKDPNGILSQWAYDPDFGRLSKQTQPDGTYTTWAYSDCAGGCLLGSHGLVSTHTNYSSGNVIVSDGSNYTDSVGRTQVSTARMLTNGSYSRNEQRYDSLGNVSWRAVPCVWTTLASACTYGTTLQYDVLNRLTQSQLTGFAATTFSYAGRRTVTTDQNGHSKTVLTDVGGNLRQTTDANGYAITLAYDAAGSHTGTTDNQGHQLWTGTVNYGIAPFTVNTTDLALGARSYTYDALGEVTVISDGNGNSNSATYDALSRLQTREEWLASAVTTTPQPDLYTYWTWDSAANGIGQLASVCTGTGTKPSQCNSGGYSESENYDSAGRLWQRSIVIPTSGNSGGTFQYTYQYNSSGFLGSITYPTTVGTPLQLLYSYNNGLLESIQDVSDSGTPTIWTANSTNAAGETTQETLGSVGGGVTVNRTFDSVRLLLNNVTAGVGGGTTLQNQSYEYDPVGNVIQRLENNLGLKENFYYDNLNRLSYSTLSSGQAGAVTNLQMCYDNQGTACTENQPGAGTITSKTADSVPPQNYSVVWTSYNYPAAITTSSESTQFSYGPDRSRWQQNYNSGSEITNYIGGALEQVVTTSGVTYRHYVYAGNEPVAIQERTSSSSPLVYMLLDHQGGIAGLLNASGGITVDESFTAFGARRNPTTWSGSADSEDLTTSAGLTLQGYTFQTALGVSMGFNHMNARVEDTSNGQFMSPDTVIQDLSNTQSFNRYAYARNNPLTYIDPTGFDDQQDVCIDENGVLEGAGSGSLIPANTASGLASQDPNASQDPSTSGLQNVGMSGRYYPCPPPIPNGIQPLSFTFDPGTMPNFNFGAGGSGSNAQDPCLAKPTWAVGGADVVVYGDASGRLATAWDGSRDWATNNPNAQGASYGMAIGSYTGDGFKSPIFPTYQTGLSAMTKQWSSPLYQNQPNLASAVSAWTGKSAIQIPDYFSAILLSLDASTLRTPVNQLSPSEVEQFHANQQKAEGYHPGSTLCNSQIDTNAPYGPNHTAGDAHQKRHAWTL